MPADVVKKRQATLPADSQAKELPATWRAFHTRRGRMSGMSSRTELFALLTHVAKWAGAICFVFALAFVIQYVIDPFPKQELATAVLTSITAGIVCLSVFALRAAIDAKWRFSLVGLLIATTMIAVVLGLLVVVVFNPAH
jgi:hypothetical protein